MTSQADFTTLTTPTRLADDEFTIDIPDGWQQGRGAFGGLVLAILMRTARLYEPETARSLRSLAAEIVGPVQTGPTQLRVEMLRRGSGVSTLAVRLSQGGELLAHAVVVLGQKRTSTQHWNLLSPPNPPPFDEVAPLAAPLMAGVRFARFFDLRPTISVPFQPNTAKVPATAGWLRLLSAGPVLTEADMIALADAWWPGAMGMEEAPRPMATLAFTFELVADPAQLRPHAPVFHRAETIVAHEGYTVERRELWSETGELLALNQQTIAIIK